jgi:6-pyruvoyltetrahydropterin/6-carboxytetrahydropterin synthase
MFRKDWTDEKNLEVFGQCSNPNWHGHNYDLFVTVKGELNKETGLVVNLKDLSRIIKKQVIQKLDHKNINLEVDFMHGVNASTENLVIKIWDELKPKIEKLGVALHCVKIMETENNYIEYFGEN